MVVLVVVLLVGHTHKLVLVLVGPVVLVVLLATAVVQSEVQLPQLNWQAWEFCSYCEHQRPGPI